MRKVILAICFSLLFLWGHAFGQERVFSTIQKAVDFHVISLKDNIGKYDNIFLVTVLEDSLVLPEHVFQIENAINPRFLTKNRQYFLVKIFLKVRSNPLKIDMTNFRVVKLSKKKIKLINLGNGSSYEIK